MRITNNFATPSFKELYLSDDFKKTLKEVKGTEQGDAIDGALGSIRYNTYDNDVLVDHFEGGKGVLVQEFDPITKNTSKLIGYSKDDIIAGLRKAAKRLFNDTENHRTTDSTRIARIYTTPRTGRHAASSRAGARINELV